MRAVGGIVGRSRWTDAEKPLSRTGVRSRRSHSLSPEFLAFPRSTRRVQTTRLARNQLVARSTALRIHSRLTLVAAQQAHSCGAFLSSGLFRLSAGRAPLRAGQSPIRHAWGCLPRSPLVAQAGSETGGRGDRCHPRYLLQLGGEPDRTGPPKHPCRHHVPGFRLETARRKSRRAHSLCSNSSGSFDQTVGNTSRSRREHHSRMGDRFAHAIESIDGED